MGKASVASYQKKACQLNAYLVFVDESGMLMAPLVRRTWWPQGHTPVLYQKTASHKKVSVIAALCIAPRRDRLHLYFRLHPDANINAVLVLEFLKNLVRQLKAPIVMVWDRFLPHRSMQVKAFAQHSNLRIYYFPPYAPELNPVENVWSYVKMNPMANLTTSEVDSLTSITRRHVKSLQQKQNLLRSFFKKCRLSLCFN